MNALVKIDPKVFTTAVVKANPVIQKTTVKKQKDLKSASLLGKNLLKLFEKKNKDQQRRDAENKKELERQKALAEEKKSEQKKVGGNILRSTLSKAKDIIGGLQQLILGLIAYKVLDWISNPNNFNQVKGLVTALKGIFDFVSAAVTFGVTNLMEGISQLVAGNLLEKFLGIIKIIAGVFVLRWISNPVSLLTDLGKLVRAIPKIRKLFGFLSDVGKKGILPAIKDAVKALAAAKGITSKSISTAVRRSLLRILGKGKFKALIAGLSRGGGAIAKLLYQASGGVIKGGIQRTATRLGLKLLGRKGLRTAGRIFSKIPIVGGLLDFGLNIALGDPVDKAAVKAIGSMLGGSLGGLIGSVIPGPGTFVGSLLGGLLGDYLADKAYGFFKNISSNANKKPVEGEDKVPGLAVGGIVTKPTLAHLAEDEPEVVIPLSKVGPGSIVESILGKPFKILGSAFLGALLGITGSLGPLGFILQPIIKSLLGPFIKEYGMKKLPMKKMAQGPSASSNVEIKKSDNGEEQSVSKLIGSSPRKNGTDVISLLKRIEDAMINFSGAAVGGGGGSGRGPGGDDDKAPMDVGPIAAGPMHQKGANIAKELMRLLNIKNYQAAGIVGNLIQESSLVPDRVQGSGMKRGVLKLDGKTGYSYPQWTDLGRQKNFAKYMEKKGHDWKNKGATDELATGFLATEFKEYMSSVFTGTKNVAAASNWVLKNYEKPADQGPREQQERAQDSAAVLAKMATGGSIKGSNKEKFFTVMNMAKQAGDKIPEITAAQFALESGYGTAVSGKYNYFGQKGTPGTRKLTTEYSGGSPYKTYAVFKDYPSPQASISEHVKMWSLDYKHYKGYGNSGNASNAAYLLKKQGYATDPAYPGKLIRIIKEQGLNPGKPSPENIPAGGDASSLGGASGDTGSVTSAGGASTTPTESSTGLDYLKSAAGAGEFTKNLATLFSALTGAPDPGAAKPSTPSYSSGKVDKDAFKNIKPLTEDFNKYYNSNQSNTVAVAYQTPVIINSGIISTTIMPGESSLSKSMSGFNLAQRL